MFEKLFGELLKDLGITEEQFVKACEDADKKEENKKYVDQILSVDDFVTFKRMMQKRNVELNEQAFKFIFLQKHQNIDCCKVKEKWRRKKCQRKI